MTVQDLQENVFCFCGFKLLFNVKKVHLEQSSLSTNCTKTKTKDLCKFCQFSFQPFPFLEICERFSNFLSHHFLSGKFVKVLSIFFLNFSILVWKQPLKPAQREEWPFGKQVKETWGEWPENVHSNVNPGVVYVLNRLREFCDYLIWTVWGLCEDNVQIN